MQGLSRTRGRLSYQVASRRGIRCSLVGGQTVGRRLVDWQADLPPGVPAGRGDGCIKNGGLGGPPWRRYHQQQPTLATTVGRRDCACGIFWAAAGIGQTLFPSTSVKPLGTMAFTRRVAALAATAAVVGVATAEFNPNRTTSVADVTAADAAKKIVTLADDCDAECGAKVVASLEAAGCTDVVLLAAINYVTASCSAASSISSLPDGVLGAAPAESVVIQAPTSFWGLDRVDESALPLDGQFNTASCYPKSGAGAEIFVIDTGCRSTHGEFSGRMRTMAAPGSRYASGEDDQGHGTHCAGSAGGSTAGVAPASTLTCIKALSSTGSGSNVDIASGLNYVAGRKQANPAAPLILSMSFGGPASGGPGQMEVAIQRLAGMGVVPVVAAGNEATDACNTSPARVAEAITVAASDSSDRLASFSNRGRTCVDVIAPGASIRSSDFSGDNSYSIKSGTSMATPHVAGVAALILAEQPGLSVPEVKAAMLKAGPSVAGYPMSFVGQRCTATPAPQRPTPETPQPTTKPTPDTTYPKNAPWARTNAKGAIRPGYGWAQSAFYVYY